MAAEIHTPTPGTSSGASSSPVGLGGGNPAVKPELINKVEGCSDDVNDVILLPDTNGIITGSSDRSLRVWQLRDSGQYWPSICHFFGAAVSSLYYCPDNRHLFVGLDTGTVSEFVISSDYNRMDAVRDYHAHQNRVTGLYFSQEMKWLLSVSRDRYFQFHCTETGKRLGGYLCNAWCTSLEYDEAARYVFIGDYSGQVTVCKLDTTGVQFVNTLKGHTGSIQTITWDGNRGWLYTGSFDSSIFVWDIAGRKGTVFELHGHRSKVTSLHYNADQRLLMSVGEDHNLVLWNMNAKRDESSDWAESDNCQLCNRPFFWNFKAMYDQKQIGLRQHHCRKCGKAICDTCSTKRSTLPIKGHEFPVRVCEECYIKITDEERRSLAVFHDLKHNVRTMDYDPKRKLLATVGQDHIIKLWSLQNVL